MKTSVEVQRRAARAMKKAMFYGVEPRNTAPKQAKIYKRMWRDDMRRKPWTVSEAIHIHEFDDDQHCECGAFYF